MSNIVVSRIVDGEKTVMSLKQSRFLDRKIYLTGTIDDKMAEDIINQLIYLWRQDPESDITMFINSPGGNVTAGMQIYDIMQLISCDVATVCTGMAASMAAFLLASGKKGKRYALHNSEIMIHQPMGGVQGQSTDIKIHATRIMKLRHKLNCLLSQMTGKSVSVIEKDTDRDNFMDSYRAVKYGIVDSVITETSNDVL